MKRFRKRWIAWTFVAAWATVGTWNAFRPMPPGTDVHTAATPVAATDVQFTRDLTRSEPSGALVHEQRIFDEVFRIIDESQSFVVADFFLLNDMTGASGAPHRPLSRQLADRLIATSATTTSKRISRSRRRRPRRSLSRCSVISTGCGTTTGR